MKKKDFDAVEMQHDGARKVQAELVGMTREEQIEYWKKQTARLLERRKRARRAKAS